MIARGANMDDGIDSLNAEMVAFSAARLRAMGEHKSGLYNYYAHRVKTRSMLSREDIAIAKYIDARTAQTPILELCAGAAQLGHLLALMGHRAFAVEMDELRHAYAVALGAHVGSSCGLILNSWQNLRLADWKILVTINAAGSHVFPSDTKWLQDYASTGGEFIIRPRQFGSAGIPVEIPGLRHTLVHGDVYHYAV